MVCETDFVSRTNNFAARGIGFRNRFRVSHHAFCRVRNLDGLQNRFRVSHQLFRGARNLDGLRNRFRVHEEIWWFAKPISCLALIARGIWMISETDFIVLREESGRLTKPISCLAPIILSREEFGWFPTPISCLLHQLFCRARNLYGFWNRFHTSDKKTSKIEIVNKTQFGYHYEHNG